MVVLLGLIPLCGPALAAHPNPSGSSAGHSLRANLAWQIALERVGFSPGVLDGTIGRKTESATREFQRVRGLPVTGRLDAGTAAALAVNPDSCTTTYTVLIPDVADVAPLPTDWIEKSRRTRLAFESLEALIAEKFHCTRGLLHRLNPGADFARLAAGDVVVVPAVGDTFTAPAADQLEINLAEKIVRVLNRERKLVALFHCSIAKDKEKRPSGEARVVSITQEPSYSFDPKMWPEVKNVDRKLMIPPGPRNPVGRCWIGLNLPGYGIHGSPAPEMIGKTGSHGCFRLTNWDALRLAKMIRPGAKVKFLS